MPCIQIKTNLEIKAPQEQEIKSQLGHAISLIPGKSEQWLMITLEPGRTIYFQGEKEFPAAFVDVSVYGSSTREAYRALTRAITDILQAELGIQASRIYVKYTECEHWGWNGENF